MELLITLVCQTQPLAVCPRGAVPMHFFLTQWPSPALKSLFYLPWGILVTCHIQPEQVTFVWILISWGQLWMSVSDKHKCLFPFGAYPDQKLCWTVQFCSIAGLWHLYLLSCFLSRICVFSFGRKLNLETTESAETRQQIVLIRNYHKLCKQCFSHREIQQYGANKSINLFMNWLKEEEKNIAFLFTDSNKPFPAGYRFYKKYLYIYR